MTRCFSPIFRPPALFSKLSRGISRDFWLVLNLSLHLRQSLPILRLPISSCSYIRIFGILSSLRRITWPVRTQWSCWIHRLHPCRGVRLSQWVSWFDSKQFDSEVPLILELWRIRSTLVLLSLPCPLCTGVVTPEKVLSMSQIELNNVLMRNWIVWNRTVFCIKVYLALITYNGWCAIKPNQTKPNGQPISAVIGGRRYRFFQYNIFQASQRMKPSFLRCIRRWSKGIFCEIHCVCDIYIIIIIMSRRLRGYPWPSLAISPYHSSPPAGLQDYNPCPHIAAVCKFVLVVPLLHIHEWGSTGVHRLWARPCFSSSVLRVWFVELV